MTKARPFEFTRFAETMAELADLRALGRRT